MTKKIHLNKTNQIVKHATNIASKDVRAPKVVRSGLVVKVSSSPQKGNK